MAKVRGPLYSISASGVIADAMVFASWKGLPWVRKQFTPQNPKTDDQKAIRLIFSQAVRKWQDQTVENKADWETAVGKIGKTESGFNFFMSEYITSMRKGQTPSTTPPAHLLP
jgi:hypothetical protein